MANQQEMRAEFERQAAANQDKFVDGGGGELTAYGTALLLVGLYADNPRTARWLLGEGRELRMTWHTMGQQLTLFNGDHVLRQGILMWSLTAEGVITAVTEAIEAAHTV